jgi:hypothetical protein
MPVYPGALPISPFLEVGSVLPLKSIRKYDKIAVGNMHSSLFSRRKLLLLAGTAAYIEAADKDFWNTKPPSVVQTMGSTSFNSALVEGEARK